MKNQVKQQDFNAFNLYVTINYSILLKTKIKLFLKPVVSLVNYLRGGKKRKELTVTDYTTKTTKYFENRGIQLESYLMIIDCLISDQAKPR